MCLLMATPYSSRSPVMATGGMVCSTSPLAASAGVRVLAAGGNAFDAAVAVAAVEAVTVPGLCGLEGEAFAILYKASMSKAVGLTSTGAARAVVVPSPSWPTPLLPQVQTGPSEFTARPQ